MHILPAGTIARKKSQHLAIRFISQDELLIPLATNFAQKSKKIQFFTEITTQKKFIQLTFENIYLLSDQTDSQNTRNSQKSFCHSIYYIKLRQSWVWRISTCHQAKMPDKISSMCGPWAPHMLLKILKVSSIVILCSNVRGKKTF